MLLQESLSRFVAEAKTFDSTLQTNAHAFAEEKAALLRHSAEERVKARASQRTSWELTGECNRLRARVGALVRRRECGWVGVLCCVLCVGVRVGVLFGAAACVLYGST